MDCELGFQKVGFQGKGTECCLKESPAVGTGYDSSLFTALRIINFVPILLLIYVAKELRRVVSKSHFGGRRNDAQRFELAYILKINIYVYVLATIACFFFSGALLVVATMSSYIVQDGDSAEEVTRGYLTGYGENCQNTLFKIIIALFVFTGKLANVVKNLIILEIDLFMTSHMREGLKYNARRLAIFVAFGAISMPIVGIIAMFLTDTTSTDQGSPWWMVTVDVEDDYSAYILILFLIGSVCLKIRNVCSNNNNNLKRDVNHRTSAPEYSSVTLAKVYIPLLGAIMFNNFVVILNVLQGRSEEGKDVLTQIGLGGNTVTLRVLKKLSSIILRTAIAWVCHYTIMVVKKIDVSMLVVW
jgi:hypothetical protein